MFDYASGIWNQSIDDFDGQWRMRTQRSLVETFGSRGPDVRDAVAANLSDGRFSIVLAVDVINPALKRMVEYLNSMSGPATSVIAVEYTRLLHGEVEVPGPFQSPVRCRAIFGSRPAVRRALAMLVAPANLWRLMARFRTLAMMWALLPVRTCEASSPKVVSRINAGGFQYPSVLGRRRPDPLRWLLPLAVR